MHLSRTLRAVALGALLAACGDDDSTSPQRGHLGTYVLRTLNGATLPVTIFEDGSQRFQVQSGRITLEASNAFTQELTVLVTVPGFPPLPQTVSCRGTYKLAGATIDFTSQGGPFCEPGTVSGTLSGNTLTVTVQSFSAVFTR